MANKSKVMANKDLDVLCAWEAQLQNLLFTIDNSTPFRLSVTLRCLGHIQHMKNVTTMSGFAKAYLATKADCDRILKINSANQEVNLLLKQIIELAETTNHNINKREHINSLRREKAKENNAAKNLMSKPKTSDAQSNDHKQNHASLFNNQQPGTKNETSAKEPVKKKIK